MYKKPLIISDNHFICEKFLLICEDLLPTIKFDVATSPFTERKSLFGKVQAIDMREEPDLDFVIKNYDIVFSIHCKQIFPDKLIDNKLCINVHPGYNPENRGWYPQVFAIINNLDIGATIHEISSELDNGPIIAREKVEKYPWDTSLTLYNRVVEKELFLIRKHLCEIMNNDYKVLKPNEKSNLFLKKDFNLLKKIDLDQKATYGEVLNKLRALTHGDYKNAYFEMEDGNKIYISLNLIKEK